mgnify:CR=1 FL=1
MKTKTFGQVFNSLNKNKAFWNIFKLATMEFSSLHTKIFVNIFLKSIFVYLNKTRIIYPRSFLATRKMVRFIHSTLKSQGLILLNFISLLIKVKDWADIISNQKYADPHYCWFEFKAMKTCLTSSSMEFWDTAIMIQL